MRVYHLIWLTGLRISEVQKLSWDTGTIQVDLEAKYAQLVFEVTGHRSRREERVPLAPEAAHRLRRTPPGDRRGPVCHGLPVSHVDKALGRISTECGVVVNRETGKRATCHDLRRTFGTRWSYKVKPLVLQKLMRHAGIQTTLKYYVQQDVDEIARDLWKTTHIPKDG